MVLPPLIDYCLLCKMSQLVWTLGFPLLPEWDTGSWVEVSVSWTSLFQELNSPSERHKSMFRTHRLVTMGFVNSTCTSWQKNTCLWKDQYKIAYGRFCFCLLLLCFEEPGTEHPSLYVLYKIIDVRHISRLSKSLHFLVPLYMVHKIIEVRHISRMSSNFPHNSSNGS